MINVFIGYDDREAAAYNVCQQSLARKSTAPLHVRPLVESGLREQGLFWREWEPGYDEGVRVDKVDGRPFSTDFAFTRFLVPELMNFKGWGLFCDCDFLFREDVKKLERFMDDDYAVCVVKHDYKPKDREKMDGQPQRVYPRKNWSSFILWNCSHPSNRALTKEIVNTKPGRWLHGFQWLADHEIGSLPEAWNWLEGWSSKDIEPCAVHLTRGGPWWPEWRNVDYADEWIFENKLKEV